MRNLKTIGQNNCCGIHDNLRRIRKNMYKKSLEKGLLKSRNENRAKLTLFYQKISNYGH